MKNHEIAVWFPTVKTGTGTDVFTIQLADLLRRAGVKAEIQWFPKWCEYNPFLLKALSVPGWATVVHVDSWFHFSFESKSIPVVATVHGCVHNPNLWKYKTGFQRMYHKFWIKKCERKALMRATRAVAVSYDTAQMTFRSLGVPGLKVIRNSVDTNFFSSPSRCFGSKPYRILYVGSLSARKGSDLLPLIAARLGEQFEIYFTGSSNYTGKNLPPNMVALGRVAERADLKKLYCGADAFIFPSRMEGLPLSILEAFACGLPVIASNCSSMPEIVVDGHNGFLCEVDNVEMFADKVLELFSDENLYKTMSHNARLTVLTEFSEKMMLESYLDVYRECVSISRSQ